MPPEPGDQTNDHEVQLEDLVDDDSAGQVDDGPRHCGGLIRGHECGGIGEFC
jgi:hypothetical protein